MKQLLKRTLSLLLIGALLTGLPVSAFELQRQSGLQLADSLRLERSYLSGSGNASEHILYYEPEGDVTPVVYYGNTLYGRSTMDTLRDYIAESDLTVVAGVNGSFFDMSTGIPYGMVVTDGILRTSGDEYTVGILEDGSMQIGRPGLEVTMTTETAELKIHYNKALSDANGFCLYSPDYDPRTKNSVPAWHFVLEPEEAELTTSTEVEAEVVKVISETTGSVEIPEDCFVLSLSRNSPYTNAVSAAMALEIGQTVTVRTTVERDWEDVSYAFGGGELLVEDGDALGGFTLDSADQKAPRTALGLTSSGDVVIYTVDRGSRSSGMTLEELAERMEELDCDIAINLDGGGSTCLGATLPGEDGFTTVNAPSTGEQRTTANFLFFVRQTRRAGDAQRLHLYPFDGAVLPGGSLELTVLASDRNYMAAEVPSDLTLTARGGDMDGMTFVAGNTGTATVTAEGDGLSGEVEILVVETPTTLTVSREDQALSLTKLTLETGSVTDLTAEASYLGSVLSGTDRSFLWEVDEELGFIDEEGTFTAAEEEAEGTLTVSCGDLTVEIPVELKTVPFTDIGTHWARHHIADLYFDSILNGSKDGAGQWIYRPEAPMTRQEFMAALMRYLKVDVEDYEDVELPFADTDKIADWAVDSIRAAYELGYFTGSKSGETVTAQPGSTITREQAMTILARTLNTEGDTELLTEFSDHEKVSDWAAASLAAMVERKIVSGISGKLVPQGQVTRSQVAKMLYTMK